MTTARTNTAKWCRTPPCLPRKRRAAACRLVPFFTQTQVLIDNCQHTLTPGWKKYSRPHGQTSKRGQQGISKSFQRAALSNLRSNCRSHSTNCLSIKIKPHVDLISSRAAKRAASQRHVPLVIPEEPWFYTIEPVNGMALTSPMAYDNIPTVGVALDSVARCGGCHGMPWMVRR